MKYNQFKMLVLDKKDPNLLEFDVLLKLQNKKSLNALLNGVTHYQKFIFDHAKQKKFKRRKFYKIHTEFLKELLLLIENIKPHLNDINQLKIHQFEKNFQEFDILIKTQLTEMDLHGDSWDHLIEKTEINESLYKNLRTY